MISLLFSGEQPLRQILQFVNESHTHSLGKIFSSYIIWCTSIRHLESVYVYNLVPIVCSCPYFVHCFELLCYSKKNTSSAHHSKPFNSWIHLFGLVHFLICAVDSRYNNIKYYSAYLKRQQWPSHLMRQFSCVASLWLRTPSQ